MVPERESGGNFMKDRKIHGESNVWSAAQRQKKIYGFVVHAGFGGNLWISWLWQTVSIGMVMC